MNTPGNDVTSFGSRLLIGLRRRRRRRVFFRRFHDRKEIYNVRLTYTHTVHSLFYVIQKQHCSTSLNSTVSVEWQPRCGARICIVIGKQSFTGCQGGALMDSDIATQKQVSLRDSEDWMGGWFSCPTKWCRQNVISNMSMSFSAQIRVLCDLSRYTNIVVVV